MFLELIEQAELLALHAAISPSIESIYRLKCRQYSVMFHTPLDRVMELDPAFVLQALYEDRFSASAVDEELEELLDRLYTIQDPTYSRISQAETEDLVDSVLQKEMKRLGKNKPSEKTLLAKNTSEKETKTTNPKSGGLSFESLEKADEAIEGNSNGFKAENPTSN